ncbi:O-antigen polymerase [Clostridium beijerinckii]|uniref:O-antigen polymerase n=1 Tax=Clostridium beijerinckii TaxID=1520 RepID=UPI00136134EE|nr:O-antigen polymerase [Clostridium beijerinckii]MZK52740.1 hypothetical protein [Clostridium beijerinckii]MZK60847.1 hypothetical protein [Clostridium beijerinckii]MZK71053.1 hypothetical protein [Clostridium beijerinckii]MZK76382.1 hypothetical protein [Clostridium beijerinckii]MZK86112.1 hypothetical protein [Clostridium beijerinckii]
METLNKTYYKIIAYKWIICLILIIFNISYILVILNKKSIESLIIMFILNCIYYSFAIKGISGNNLIRNIFFILPTVFFLYAVSSPIIFVLNEYKPVVNYFYVDYNIVFETLKIYYFAYLIIIFGGIVFYRDMSVKNKVLIKVRNKRNICVNIFCYILILGTCEYFIIKYGTNIFNMSKTDILYGGNINAQLIHYINIVLVCFSYKILSNLIINKVNDKFSIFMISFYWIFSLTLGMRRELVLLILMLVFTYSIEKEKISKRIYIFITFILIYLLFYAFIRQDYYSLNENLGRVLYVSLAEFILPQYISYYYFVASSSLKYGVTYLYAFTQFIPRILYESKPINLGIQFIQQSGVNVGFAFNPIAEGLINFGKYSSLIVGILVLALMIYGREVYRKNNLIYIILLASSVDFNRGQFSVYLIDIIIIYFILRGFGISKPSITMQSNNKGENE